MGFQIRKQPRDLIRSLPGVQLVDPGILQARNYNEEVIVVRYATLVALVIWLGAMVDERFGDVFRRAHLIPYACGAA